MNSTSTMNVDESTRLGVGRYLDMPSRKISVSFVSEVAPTCNSIDPTQAFHYGPDPNLKALQQKILRLQVSQVVLGLTLMVLSGVALIEERGLFGLGFGLISALVAIISAAFGIQQCDLKMTSILNIFALLGLFPTFYFATESLIYYSRFYFSSSSSNQTGGGVHGVSGEEDISGRSSLETINEFHTKFDIVNEGALNSMDYYYDSSTITTIWALSWLELFHLIPLAASILYLLFLYRHLSYYTHC